MIHCFDDDAATLARWIFRCTRKEPLPSGDGTIWIEDVADYVLPLPSGDGTIWIEDVADYVLRHERNAFEGDVLAAESLAHRGWDTHRGEALRQVLLVTEAFLTTGWRSQQAFGCVWQRQLIAYQQLACGCGNGRPAERKERLFRWLALHTVGPAFSAALRIRHVRNHGQPLTMYLWEETV